MRRARLIRGAPAERATRIVPGARYEALADAAQIRADAEAEAQTILDSARTEADRTRAAATAEGRERGLAAVTELLVSARAESLRSRRAATLDLRALAVKIAEKLLGRTLALDPSAVVDLTAEALRHAGDPKAVRIRCSPEDLALLESGRPRLLDRARSAGALHLEADPRIERGGCVIESELGSVDARLSVQLDAIERALRGEST